MARVLIVAKTKIGKLTCVGGLNLDTNESIRLLGADDWNQPANTPYGVSRAYSAALRVQKADAEAFAIMVGRTLEEICRHEKAKGKVLADKIKSLADSGRIPQVLADMITQLRLLRNLAAHSSEDNYVVTEEDVPIIREFIDAVLEYLYIAQAKITHLQDRISGKFDKIFYLIFPIFDLFRYCTDNIANNASIVKHIT